MHGSEACICFFFFFSFPPCTPGLLCHSPPSRRCDTMRRNARTQAGGASAHGMAGQAMRSVSLPVGWLVGRCRRTPAAPLLHLILHGPLSAIDMSAQWLPEIMLRVSGVLGCADCVSWIPDGYIVLVLVLPEHCTLARMRSSHPSSPPTRPWDINTISPFPTHPQ